MPSALTCTQGHQWDPHADAHRSRLGKPIACPTCGAAPTLESLGAPRAVAAAIQRLLDDAQQAIRGNLAGIILYGGLARGRYRPGKSDVNLVVLLGEASAPALASLAPMLHRAWRAAAVEPLILTPEEVQRAADVFATKFLDIRDHHVVLLGEDPFAELEISPKHLRLRVEQSLQNLLMRLRRRFVLVADDPAGQARVLASAARPLAIELAALLRLANKALPEEDRTTALFASAARAFDLDAEALAEMAALRQDAEHPEGSTALFGRVLRCVTQAAQVADRLEDRL